MYKIVLLYSIISFSCLNYASSSQNTATHGENASYQDLTKSNITGSSSFFTSPTPVIPITSNVISHVGSNNNLDFEKKGSTPYNHLNSNSTPHNPEQKRILSPSIGRNVQPTSETPFQDQNNQNFNLSLRDQNESPQLVLSHLLIMDGKKRKLDEINDWVAGTEAYIQLTADQNNDSFNQTNRNVIGHGVIRVNAYKGGEAIINTNAN